MAKETIQKVQKEIQRENVSAKYITSSQPKCIKNKAVRLKSQQKKA